MLITRFIFLVCVLVNLLLFAYSQGYIVGDANQGEPDRLLNQVHAEQLQIISRNTPPPLPPPAPSFLPSVSPSSTPFPPIVLQATHVQVAPECAPTEPSGWWVFIPRKHSLSEAEQKLAELKQLGVQDFFIVRDAGHHQFAISLGFFKKEAAARLRLKALEKTGVRSARLLARNTRKDACVTKPASQP